MKIKYSIIVLIGALAFTTTKLYAESLAKKCEISGVVKDSTSMEGLPFASLQLLALSDSSFVKGTMTDVDGKYLMKNVQTGEYLIMASYMGYTPVEKTLDVRIKKVICDISMLQKSISLSEFSITAEKSLIEKSLDKTVVNISKDMTVSGGSATDVLQTLPSLDIDMDGNINYRGSDKVIILLNGEKSALVKSLDQIPSNQIDRVELINNPSAKYESEGMSGIINIVLKAGKVGKNKTTLMIYSGLPETFGGNAGYSGMAGKTRFFINGGMKHNTKFQIKEHLRENYENPDALNYQQYDRQDERLNDAFFNSNFEYAISEKQSIGVSLIASKKFNNADRRINYETLDKSGQTIDESLKEIEIDLNNYTLDGSLNYKYKFTNGALLTSKLHYSYFDQLQEMDHDYYLNVSDIHPEFQQTSSKQINKQTDFSLNYLQPLNESVQIETGYKFDLKDLSNEFVSEGYLNSEHWISDTTMTNNFKYQQQIHAAYFSLKAQLKHFELQAGLRAEFTDNSQNNAHTDDYFDLFPSVNLSRKLNQHLSVFVGYNRRINRPNIKMLNPYSTEYADLLNRHKGNPDLKPEYVNSVELGNRFVYRKISGSASFYYRNIDQAITRVKSASNESALYVSYLNLNKAILIGGEFSLSYKPFKWWNINSNSNIFNTNLSGEYENNQVDNSQIGWTSNFSNNFKLPKDLGLQISAYYRSKLPSVMGTYKERYYLDLAVNKKILKNKAQLIFKISDLFNSYKFALDLDALDENNFRYSQKNKRKNQSRYFILNFIYNINGKDQAKKKQKENFFLDEFDK